MRRRGAAPGQDPSPDYGQESLAALQDLRPNHGLDARPRAHRDDTDVRANQPAQLKQAVEFYSARRIGPFELAEIRRSASSVGDLYRTRAELRKAETALRAAQAQERMAEALAAVEHGGAAVMLLARLQESLTDGRRRPLPGRVHAPDTAGAGMSTARARLDASSKAARITPPAARKLGGSGMSDDHLVDLAGPAVAAQAFATVCQAQ
jgi:hypothetical protein